MISDSESYMVPSPRMGAAELSYLPEVLKGLGTTMKHILGVMAGDKERYLKTIQYPEERRENMEIMDGGMYKANYRGVHRLNRDEQGRVKCVACFMCATACPANCIHIEGAPSPWDDREKYPVKFDLDELRCIYCGMCEEACPVDAIELTPEYDIVGLSRQEMIFDKQKLLSVFDQTIAKKPM